MGATFLKQALVELATGPRCPCCPPATDDSFAVQTEHRPPPLWALV